ncbi:MAG: hypothetical protein DK304_000293 [Chloroflexi bacterium]|jgi:hypothetical protein|nr:MAG: hypothetical protein DK304_000293 [Chloroflexota bacterium]
MKTDIANLANQRIAEIVESSSTCFTANCYQLYESPQLGALVQTFGDYPTFAIVRGISTSPLDPTRKPVARAQDEDSEEAVYRNNPQLPSLLRTDFEATIVGHEFDGLMRKYLPPHPPKIHTFVYRCSNETIGSFIENLDFLPILFSKASLVTDEVAAAFLRNAASIHNDQKTFILSAGQQLARIFHGDTKRLETLLRSLGA